MTQQRIYLKHTHKLVKNYKKQAAQVLEAKEDPQVMET